MPNGPIFDIFPSLGQHLHLGFDEFGPISGRSVRHRIHDLANWWKLQNCNCGNLDNLRIFLHTSHIFAWGSSACRKSFCVLLWVYEQPNHTVFTRGLGYEMEFSSLYGKSYLLSITIFDKNDGQCIYKILSIKSNLLAQKSKSNALERCILQFL